MKLTKKQETEVWQVYNKWLDAYLNGDTKTYNKYLDKDYHFIGSTNNEEFLNKKDTTNFFKDTADQLAGKCDLRNESKIIEKFEGLVFVTHLFDAWFKNGDDYTYYGRFRFTNTLKENKQGWRFIYQHFSMPDSKTAEGETIGFDKVHLENQELREAIQRRTIELELKNRELEVETALERIRAQAVAMKQSTDLLDIVVTMRNEFIKLGHEAHYFWHMMWLPETYEKAMTSSDGSKIGFVMQLPRHIHGDIPQLAKWEKSKKPTVVYTMNVDEAIDYVDKMVSLGDFKNIDPQAPTHDDIRHIGGLTFIMARTTHGEIGYSLPGVVKNPPKKDIEILVKFASAFDLAHQRFLDLEKAEKQARETQIELSLERIRSRVTAMQESSDLFDIVVTMRNEFLSLGHEADYFWHMKWAKDNYEMSMTAEDGGRLGMVITVPKFVHEEIENLYQWEKSNSPYFVLALNGKDAWDYIEKMNTYGKYKLADPHAPTEEDILHLGGLTFVIARTTHGEIGFSLSGKIDNPPKTSIEILVRFAQVFDLAYKRFEDLKKAEAQARETQIELALEKVRSRTMAMQHSDELQEASFLLDQQVRELGIKTWGCAFNIYGENESTEWFGNEAGVLHTYTVPREGIFKDYYEKGQKGETLFIQEFSGEACVEHYEYMSTLPVIGDVLKILKETNNGFPTFQIDHVVYFKYGYLLFITREHVPEAHDIFKRFAKVFEQTYTRFLDLQKAEKQAREAQIEAALERVRSRSMAMHKSEELQDVIHVVHKELLDLNISIKGGSFIAINDDISTEIRCWGSGGTANTSIEIIIPRYEKPFYTNLLKGIKKGVGFFTENYSQEEKKAFFKHLFNFEPWSNLSKKEKNDTLKSPGGYSRSCCVSKFTSLFIVNHFGKQFTEAENNILKRFSNVFEQTYTRFLDLQKAEAQAREAQIEAALERVRSRSMAMHNSEEIGDVAFVLFQQLKSLGGEFWGTGFGFCKKDSEVDEFWFANEEGIMPHLKIPNTKDIAHKRMYQGWKKNLESFSMAKGGQELKDHYKYMLAVPDVQPIFQGMLDNGVSFPNWQKWHAAYFKYGYLLAITTEPYKNEDIFKRFAKVFEQAYTRFLDLQKAEAQAREAQIENALEKVRSRTMAMQHSKELPEAANVLFTEVQNLGIPAWSCGYNILSEDKKSSTCIMSSEGEIQSPFVLPLTEHKSLKPWHQAILNDEEFFVYEQGGKDLVEHYKYMQSLPDLKEIFEQLKDADIPLPTFQVNHLAKFTNGFLLFITYERVPKAHDIFQRFAKVFEQTYTRFLDLKKAEAQARQAEIEVAVERVRAEAMAMHTTSDFEKVAQQLLKQVKNLDVDGFTGASILIIDDNEIFTWWDFSSPGNFSDPKSEKFRYDPHKYELLGTDVLNKWKEGDSYMVFNYDLEKLKRAIKEWTKINKNVANDFKKAIASGHLTHQWNPCGRLSNGLLAFDMVKPPDDDVKSITIKMTHAFEQAYIRFLDLQKAEKQAREAQIEAALERTRTQSMLMQHSDELDDTSKVFHQQLLSLGVESEFSYVWLPDVENDKHKFWATWTEVIKDKKEVFSQSFTYDLDKNEPYTAACFEAWKSGEPVHIVPIPPEEVEQFFSIWSELLSGAKNLNAKNFTEGLYYAEAYMKYGCFGINIRRSLTIDEQDILKRFANEFERTYTRFLDLKKAEEQTRKAQIEASLERVRARAMAMHDSNELDEVLSVLCEQFDVLGIVPMSTHMTVLDFENNTFTFRETGKFGNRSFGEQTVALDAMHNWKETVDKWKADKATAINKLHFPKEQLKEVWEVFHESFASMPEGSRIKPKDYPDGIYHTAGKHPFGYIGMNQIRPATKEEEQIVIKFANEFGRAYQRFLDLKKAEAQAREAQIEAALEKIRSRSLAMHTTDELQEVVALVAEKLKDLGVIFDAGGVILCTYFPDNKDVMHWIAAEDFSYSGNYLVPYFETTIFNETWESKNRGDDYFSKEFSVKDKNSFFEYAFEHSDYKRFPEEFKQHALEAERHRITAAWSKNSAILIPSFTEVSPSENDADILKRFAKVFEQAYIRFMDLQKAEERARETQIDIALERVRSRAMAMHQSDELSEAAELLYQEFSKLGVTPFSCGYLIFDKEHNYWKVWMTDANDETFKNFWTLPYDADHHLLSRYNSWKNKEAFHSSVLEGDENIAHHKVIAQYAPWKQESMGELPQTLVLSSAHFTHGHLLIVTPETLTKEVESILTRFATVFDQTYIRFLDLKRAEHQALLIKNEKERLEKTLSDLQATQKQLIQSEKMASLGELTAGIAHEIQNPLNFVNNFSEVSKELLDEMLEELENGDMEEVKAIMDDVVQNLEKINHHGKRADGIVKGMLQHSRASGDKKEPTDINALADEYMRLAYHGLRAKDKSFNSDLETDYDESITVIDVIPQDIGRVILNLFTNAFYAVDEKKKSGLEDYKSTVWVSTKNLKDNIEISVKDNGSGIPKHVVDKIFQPFFTTKPTGQGTGLGLSMSYDIIKAHDGGLKVKTEEGKGTEFSIILPKVSN